MDKSPNKLRWYERFTLGVVTFTETIFFKLGRLIASHPYKTIAICWILVFLSAFGFLRFYQEKNPMRLWVPAESQFVKDSDWLMNTFESAYRVQAFIAVSENVLTPEVLLELYELDGRVRSSRSPKGIAWDDVCFKIPEIDHGLQKLLSNDKRYRPQNKTDKFDPSVHLKPESYCTLIGLMDNTCYEKSILDLWQFKERKIKKLTQDDIINKINEVKIDPLLGHLKNYEALLGGVVKNESGHIISAKSIMTTYMAHLNFTSVDMSAAGNDAGTGDWASLECLEWENEYLRILHDAQKNLKNFKIYYNAGRSFGDISGATMFQDLDILFCGIFIMVIYVQLVISKYNCVEARIYLGGFGLLSVGMSFIVAVGFCSLFGVFYGPVHTSLPFLLMGLGVDDMFVIVACWKQLTEEQKRLPLETRVGLMLRHAGVSITVTTATDVLAFVVGSTTVLPCLRSFCIYTALGVLMTFIFVITFFVACFSLDQKRIENNYSGFFPWKRYENYKPNKCSQAEISSKVFNWVYSKIILTWPGKLFVILLTLSCLGISINAVFKLEQKFDPKWFIPQHTYLGQFLEKKTEYYPTSGFEAGTYIGAVNYTYEFVNIRRIVDKLENSTDIVTDLNSWVVPFTNFVSTYYDVDLNEVVLNDANFSSYLSKFLFSPTGARYQANFKFAKKLECGSPASEILLSSIEYRFKSFSGPSQHIPAMRRVTAISKEANFTTGDEFSTAWSRIFSTWITDEIIDVEVIRNIELALIAVMACTSMLIANVQICFWVFICIVLSMVNVCGFMQIWGLTIDLVSCIGLQLAIGLCVDYATHIGHTFLTIGEGSLNERVIKTVTSIGSAVLYGGLSTLIGVSMLGFSDAYNFQAFFKIFMLVIIFGLFHGIVLLPVILSWVGPKPYYTHKPVQQRDIEIS